MHGHACLGLCDQHGENYWWCPKSRRFPHTFHRPLSHLASSMWDPHPVVCYHLSPSRWAGTDSQAEDEWWDYCSPSKHRTRFFILFNVRVWIRQSDVFLQGPFFSEMKQNNNNLSLNSDTTSLVESLAPVKVRATSGVTLLPRGTTAPPNRTSSKKSELNLASCATESVTKCLPATSSVR